MLSLCLFSPSISLLSVHCFMLCRALREGKEGIVLKNIRVFWLKDTKLICFTEPGSILFDNCTPLNRAHVAKFITLITRPWSFVLQAVESLLQLENVNLVKHMSPKVAVFSLTCTRLEKWRSYSSHWTGKSRGPQHCPHYRYKTPRRPVLETEPPLVVNPNLSLVARA